MGDLRFSIVIACHNEAATIERKLANTCALSCPAAFEVLVVDDRSTDATRQCVERFIAARQGDVPPVVRLLPNGHQAGKNGALLTALEQATGTVLLITDADVDLDPPTLESAWAWFERDPRLGGLCLTPALRSSDATLLERYAAYYEPFNRRIKMFQSRLDSVPMLHGQAMFVRAACRVRPNPQLPADDVDFALQVRVAGYRVRYAAELPFYEAVTADRQQLDRQKIRRAKAVMRSLWHHRRLLLNARYGWFGMVCYPIDFALYFGVVPAVVALIVGAAWLLVQAPAAAAAGLVIAATSVLLRGTRQLLLYARLLLTAHRELWQERVPRLRWLPHRP